MRKPLGEVAGRRLLRVEHLKPQAARRERLQGGERGVAQHDPPLEGQHDPEPRHGSGRGDPGSGQALEHVRTQQARGHQVEHLAGQRQLQRRERVCVVSGAEVRPDLDDRESRLGRHDGGAT